ncbi:MAG: ankyrin repeat domain-containing protein [Planctomycetota bacterium]
MDFVPLILCVLAAVFVLGGCRFAQPVNAGAALHRHPAPDDPRLAEAVAMIDDGDAAAIKRLLAEHPGLIHQRVVGGHDMYQTGYFREPTLLHFVAANPSFEGERLPANLVEVAGVILDAGAEVDAGCGDDRRGTTLGLVASGMLARTNGLQESLIRLLVERGADPDRAIGAALSERELGAAELLIGLGAAKTLSVHAAFDEGQQVKRLLQQGEPSEQDRRLALAYAALYGNRGPIFHLCSADCGNTDPNAYNPDGAHGHATPLHLAAYHGHADAVRELVKWGARLDMKDKLWGATPRGWAEYGGHDEIVALLDGFAGRDVEGGE